MSSELIDLIDESIALELNVSALYMVFYELFPKDETFWWTLALEEKAHASLLKSVEKIPGGVTMLSQNLLHNNLDKLKEANRALIVLIEKIKKFPPSRREAFKTALKLENSAAELHFQDFMVKETNSEIVRQLQKLNQSDKDHYIRIEAYMKAQGV